MLLTIPEAAEMLRCSRQSVYRWIRQEKLPKVRLPSGSYRVRLADIERIIDGDEAEGDAA